MRIGVAAARTEGPMRNALKGLRSRLDSATRGRPARGPLVVSAPNPRYFAFGAPDGPLAYLTGHELFTGRWFTNPPSNDGRKVVIADTDHLARGGGVSLWAWKSFLRGHHP
jgi:hypothetical protein